MTTLNGTYIVYSRWRPEFCATAEDAYKSVHYINDADHNWVDYVECPEGVTKEAFDKAADAWEIEYERKLAAERATPEYQNRYPKATHRLMVRSTSGHWEAIDWFYPKHDEAHRTAAIKVWVDAIGQERVRLEDMAPKLTGTAPAWTTHP
jgi:hypothetical protein